VTLKGDGRLGFMHTVAGSLIEKNVFRGHSFFFGARNNDVKSTNGEFIEGESKGMCPQKTSHVSCQYGAMT